MSEENLAPTDSVLTCPTTRQKCENRECSYDIGSETFVCQLAVANALAIKAFDDEHEKGEPGMSLEDAQATLAQYAVDQGQVLTQLPSALEQVTRHPSVAHVMQFFECDHLPDNLKAVSMPICGLANWMADVLPPNPETTVALRKLLEAKDAAVRAVVITKTGDDNAKV